MNKPMTTIQTWGNTPAYETTVDQVWMKGCRPKAIGKTGYTSVKVPSLSSKAPATYRLVDPQGVTVDYYLSMVNLKAGMVRRGLNKPVTKKKALAPSKIIEQLQAMRDEMEAAMAADDVSRDELFFMVDEWDGDLYQLIQKIKG